MTHLIITSVEQYQQALESGRLSAATSLVVRYCAALTEIAAPAATSLEVWSCSALTEIAAPAATSLEVRHCAALTEIAAPAATSLEVWDCPALTRAIIGVTSYNLKFIDGYSNSIGDWQTSGDYEVTSGFIIGAGFSAPIERPTKIAKLGEHYAHGKTYLAAKRGAAFKNCPDHYDEDDLRESIMRRGYITPVDFHLVTTACLDGIMAHLEGQGFNDNIENMPIDEALTAMSGTSYGARFDAFWNGRTA